MMVALLAIQYQSKFLLVYPLPRMIATKVFPGPLDKCFEPRPGDSQ
jgi:hypothetical protein